MFEGKFLCTVIAIFMAIFAISNFQRKKSIKENFGFGLQGTTILSSATQNKKGHLQATRVNNAANYLMSPDTVNRSNELVMGLSGGLAQVASPTVENYNYNAYPSGQYHTPRNTQKMLSPRGGTGNVHMGANIRYNPPASQNMAINREEFINIVKENYDTSCLNKGTDGPYQAAPTPPPSNFTAGDYQQKLDSLGSSNTSQVNADLKNSLPVPDMTDPSLAQVGEDGSGEDVINYNRMIVANPKGRLYSQGCPIRGDLTIHQCDIVSRPSANPSRDLHQGAMGVLTGFNPNNDEMSKSVRLAAAARGSQNGGVAFAGTLLSQDELMSVNAMTDVNVSLIP